MASAPISINALRSFLSQQNDSPRINLVKSYSTVFGAILMHAVIGATQMGNLVTYMTSYMRVHVSTDINYGQNIWLSSVGVTAFALFTIAGGYLTRLIPFRGVVWIGLFTVCLANYLSAIAINHSFAYLLWTFGFMQSAGIGLIYSNVIVMSTKWIPKYRGVITGLIVALDSVSTFLVMQIQTMYFNPNNLEANTDGYFTDPDILNRVPVYFRNLALIFLISGTIGVVLIFKPSAEYLATLSAQTQQINIDQQFADASTHGTINALNDIEELESSISWTENFLEKDVLGILKEEIENDMERAAVQRQQADTVQQDSEETSIIKNYFGVRKAMRTKMALVLFITFGLSTESSYFIGSMGKPFGQSFIYDDHYLAAIISLSNLANCFGSFLCGKLLDKWKFKRTMILVNGVVSALYFSFILSNYYAPKFLYAVWSIAINFTSIGFFSSHLPEVMNKFGDKHATAIYGIIHIGPVLSSLILSPIMEYLINYYGWFSTFLLVGMLNFLSMLIIMVFYRTRKV